MRARSTNVLSALACRVQFHSHKPVKWRRFLPPETFPPGTVRCSNRRMILSIRHGQDRAACRWLIRKFIDPSAEFVFLPAGTDRLMIAERIVFEVPNCELGHRGENVPGSIVCVSRGIHAVLTSRDTISPWRPA